MKKFIIETEDNINDSLLMKIFDVYLPSEYSVEEIKPIDETKLDDLAKLTLFHSNVDSDCNTEERVCFWLRGFKAGYRKAMVLKEYKNILF